MSSRLRQPTERELRDLAMTLAGEIDLSRSPISSPDTRVEAANILATVVNRFSTDEPHRFGRSQVRQYDGYSDVVRNAGQYNAWMGQHVGTTQRNYDANRSYWDGAVKDFFSGELAPSAPNATHYHATQVTPGWSRELERVGQSGPHIFYNDEAYMGRPLGERRPSYVAAAPTLPEAGQDQPNPSLDLNAQELASIAPTTPASPQSMLAAKTPSVPQPTIRPDVPTQSAAAGAPMQQRTIGGYIAQEMGVPPERVVEGLMAPGASDRAIRGASGLTPETQQRLANVAGMLPSENQPQITSTIRNDRFRTHNYGGAVDLRNRDRTPFQEAQQVAALAKEGFEAIGPYADGRFPSHIHVGDNPIYNRQGSRFQSASRTDNPYLSGTQPNSGLYDAVDSGSPVSDAWFGPTAPTPTPSAQARNQGDGSLDAVPGLTPSADPRNANFGPLPAETTPRLSETYAPQRTAPQSSFLARPMTPGSLPAAPQRTSGGSIANVTPRVNQGFNDALAPRSMPTQMVRVSPQGSYGTHAPRRSPDQFQYARPAAPSPATSAPALPAAPAGPSKDAMLASYGARALQNADPFTMAAAPTPAPSLPAPSVPAPSVPNPIAAPRIVPNPTPRASRFGAVPSPMARPDPRQNPIEQAVAGFNDWITPRLGPMAGTAIGGALGGPLGALVGGLGGYGIQQVAANNGGNVSFVQGSNLPSANTPNWQDNTGLPTYASVTGRSGGTGASAHDAWSDSLGSSFY